MAGSDYVRGEMDVAEQTQTWEGFLAFVLWSMGLIILVIGYATFTIALGMHWMVALGICAIGGFAGGLLMRMGSAWTAMIFGLTALAVIIQLLIIVFSAFG